MVGHSSAQNWYIRVFHIPNRTVTNTTTAAGILGSRRISTHTVRNSLRIRGMRTRISYVGPVLTQVHICVRVRWFHTLMVWTLRNWCRFWFRDESRFLLQRCDGGPAYTDVEMRVSPCLRTGSLNIFRWKRHDVDSNILQPQKKPSACLRKFKA